MEFTVASVVLLADTVVVVGGLVVVLVEVVLASVVVSDTGLFVVGVFDEGSLQLFVEQHE